jgi:hypothetical protein
MHGCLLKITRLRYYNFEYLDTWILENSTIPVSQYSSIPVSQYSSIPVFQYPSIPVFKNYKSNTALLGVLIPLIIKISPIKTE